MTRTVKTSVTDPIKVAAIHCPGTDPFVSRGKIGITLCPGKKGPSSFGGTWDRDLQIDLSAIEQQFKPAVAVTLMTDSELDASGVQALGQAFVNKGIQWIHLPMPESSSPDESSISLGATIPYLLSLLAEGCNVLIHDRGGLGRSGCLAAVLLIELGMSNSDAINTVRRSRPGAIETPAQELFVSNYIPHNLPHFFCHGCVQFMIRIWAHVISPMNNLLRKPEPPSRKLEHNIYRTFVQDFKHYMCGVGAQLNKLTTSLEFSPDWGLTHYWHKIGCVLTEYPDLQLRSKPLRFPSNFHRWAKTYSCGTSMGVYQPPDEPKVLVDWWRSISLPIIHSRHVDSNWGEQLEEVRIPLITPVDLKVIDKYVELPEWKPLSSEEMMDSLKRWEFLSGRTDADTFRIYKSATGCLDDNAPRRLGIEWDQLSRKQNLQIQESMYSIQKYFDDYYRRFNQMIIVHQELLCSHGLPWADLLWPRANQHHRARACTFPAFPSERTRA